MCLSRMEESELVDVDEREPVLFCVPEDVLALLHQHVVLFEEPVRARGITSRNMRRNIVTKKKRVHSRWLDSNEAIAFPRVQLRQCLQRRAVVHRVMDVAI